MPETSRNSVNDHGMNKMINDRCSSLTYILRVKPSYS